MKLPINEFKNNVGTGRFAGVISLVKKIRNYKKVTFIIVLAALAVVYGTYWYTTKDATSAEQNTAEAAATRGSIEVTVTGTGTILPVSSEDIGKNVSGTVKSINVQNGEKVKKGDLLMEVTNDTLKLQLENARLDLEKAAINLDDSSGQLAYDTITSPFSGRIVSMDLKKGEDVSKNAVLATLQDDSQLVFDMPVDSVTAQKVSINQKVEVFLPDQGETVNGRVMARNTQAVSGYNGENRVYLKVAVAATGNLSSGTKAFGTLTIAGKEVDALSVSTLEWIGSTQVKATLAGEVSGIYVQEGQAVKAGQRLFALRSDTAQTQQKTQQVAYEQAQLNVINLKTQLDDLTVRAPIDGTVSGMDVKEGDEIGDSKSSQTQASSNAANNASGGTLGKIINTGQMEVSFSVDEVDIAKVKIGQTANVTVDALPDQSFKGKVTEIAEEGVVTNNVGSFEVTIMIDNPNTLLKSGMTANVTIVVAKKDDVVLIPIEALQEMGRRKFVLTPVPEGAAGTAGSGRPQGSARSDGAAGSAGSEQRRGRKPVSVGLTNESFAEITEGLQEGDKVLLPGQQANSARTVMPFGGGNRPGGAGGARSGGTGSRSGGGFGGLR
ncbi:MAG TPA: HlyD family efflux transporter periplasmic adaptor subunit [Desulfobacteria bacterium]|nr:HlyD family efflux transporter periplasmic adaptor subunit [Desulfobacteria bacterium]